MLVVSWLGPTFSDLRNQGSVWVPSRPASRDHPSEEMPPRRAGGGNNLKRKTLEALKQSVADGELSMINALLRRLEQMGAADMDEVKTAKAARDELSHAAHARNELKSGLQLQNMAMLMAALERIAALPQKYVSKDLAADVEQAQLMVTMIDQQRQTQTR